MHHTLHSTLHHTLQHTHTHAPHQGDRAARAYEAAARLNTTQSLEGALRLANHMRAGPLAERIGKLVETRIMEDSQAAAMDDDVAEDDADVGGNGHEEGGGHGTHHGGDAHGTHGAHAQGGGAQERGGKENTTVAATVGCAMALLGKGGGAKTSNSTYVLGLLQWMVYVCGCGWVWCRCVNGCAHEDCTA